MMQKNSVMNYHGAETASLKIVAKGSNKFFQNVFPVTNNLPPHIKSLELLLDIRNIVNHIL